MRIGAKKKPFYRVVAVDERAKRTGGFIELLGTYNPLTEPKEIKLKQDRIDYWIKQGAQLSTGFLRIIGKAPQRLPRKPKKEKKTEKLSVVSDQTSEQNIQEEKPIEKTEEAKSEADKASGEVEHIAEAEDSSAEQDAKQAPNERSGDTSDALQPDELPNKEKETNERPA